MNKLKVANKKGYEILKDGTILGASKSKINGFVYEGYRRVSFRCEKGLKTYFKVHRLQAFQKFGDDMFKKGIVVRHLNGNSLDNSYVNIAIGTQSDNMMDIPEEKRISNASNPKHNHESIIKDHKEGMSYRAIMKKYSISSKGTVSYIIKKSIKNES